MANFFRLIFVALSVFFSGQVFADCTAAVSACNTVYNASNSSTSTLTCIANTPYGGTTFYASAIYRSTGAQYTVYANCASQCPTGSTTGSNGSCVAPAAAVGTVMATGWFNGTATSPVPVVACFNGTEATPGTMSGPLYATGSTQAVWKGSYVSDGNSCTVSSSNTPASVANPTAAPALNNAPASPPVTAVPTAQTATPTAPYAGPTVTNNTNTTNINTTTTTTTNPDGSTTSTTTGSTTGSSTTDLSPVVAAVNGTTAAVDNTTAAVNSATQAIKDNGIFQFCIDNPTLPECKPSSIIDACNGFSCTGDAIQCAMAQSQHDIICQYKSETNPTLDIGQQMIDGTDNTVPNPAAPANRLSVDLPTQLDSSSPIVASCPPDIVFYFQGNAITMPVSQWCDMLTIVGNIFMALSFLSGARIVGSEV